MRKNTKKVALVASLCALTACVFAAGCGDDKPSEYKVYMLSDAAYSITGETQVKAGEDYTFTVTPTKGYDASQMKVTVNGEEVTGVNGVYTVTGVKDTLAIHVTGVKAPVTEYVDVTFAGDHVDFSGDFKAEKGSKYTFSAKAYDGYTLTEVKCGGKTLTAENGVYSVTASENLEITATAEVVINYSMAVKPGDTPCVGGKVAMGEDGREHITIKYDGEDRFMKPGSETDCYYHEVGFTLSEEAWAEAHVGANLAIVTMRVNNWGEDVSEDIGCGGGISFWHVQDGLATLGGGNMKWPGVDPNAYAGNTVVFELTRDDKICIRNADGFDASIMDVKFITAEVVHTDLGSNINIVMDSETHELYLRCTGTTSATIDLKKILGDDIVPESGTQWVGLELHRLDDQQFSGSMFMDQILGTKHSCYADAGIDANSNGLLTISTNYLQGLSKIIVTRGPRG